MPMSVVYTSVDGEALSEIRNNKEAYYVPDTIGSLVEVRDVSGSIVYSADYWPYGELRVQAGTNPTPWGYVGLFGYLLDSATLVYVRARYYRSNYARWQTVDPLWPSENAYHYVNGDPVGHSDRNGMGDGVAISPSQVEEFLKSLAALLGIILSAEVLAFLVELIMVIVAVGLTLLALCKLAQAAYNGAEGTKNLARQADQSGGCGGCCKTPIVRCPCILENYAIYTAAFINQCQIQLFCYGGNVDQLHLKGLRDYLFKASNCACSGPECFPLPVLKPIPCL